MEKTLVSLVNPAFIEVMRGVALLSDAPPNNEAMLLACLDSWATVRTLLKDNNVTVEGFVPLDRLLTHLLWLAQECIFCDSQTEK